MTATPEGPDGSDSSVSVLLCPGGPMLLRGAREVVDDEGVAHPVDRPTVAVCRCGRSQRMPWCDSTHKLGPDNRRKR